MSKFRIYFYDQTGREMTEHEGNGKTWLGHSGSEADAELRYDHLYKSAFRLCDYGSLRKVVGERLVTIADFPGETRVGVKVWYGPGHSEKYWLVEAGFLTKSRLRAKYRPEHSSPGEDEATWEAWAAQRRDRRDHPEKYQDEEG